MAQHIAPDRSSGVTMRLCLMAIVLAVPGVGFAQIPATSGTAPGYLDRYRALQGLAPLPGKVATSITSS
jgi:hypothetical protein